MTIYIRGTGLLSPQNAAQHDRFLEEFRIFENNYLTIADPGYRNYIDPKLIRRMSKVIKMGVAAAKICLDDASVSLPGAILVGTGLGCIEDTERFLTEIISNREELLTPTSFIQSTHNTVAAQIALMLKCHEVNFTYVHRGFSFELAMADAIMQFEEGTAENILVGGLDELTPATSTILKRLGIIKQKPVSSNALFNSKSRGTIYGEGASFFLLTDKPEDRNYAILKSVTMHFGSLTQDETENFIKSAVNEAGIELDEISMVIGGMSGDHDLDAVYRLLQNGILKNKTWAGFKHLCGEYHTASAFGVWLAAKMIKEQRIPEAVIYQGGQIKEIKNILVYNQFSKEHHSAFVLQLC